MHGANCCCCCCCCASIDCFRIVVLSLFNVQQIGNNSFPWLCVSRSYFSTANQVYPIQQYLDVYLYVCVCASLSECIRTRKKITEPKILRIVSYKNDCGYGLKRRRFNLYETLLPSAIRFHRSFHTHTSTYTYTHTHTSETTLRWHGENFIQMYGVSTSN